MEKSNQKEKQKWTDNHYACQSPEIRGFNPPTRASWEKISVLTNNLSNPSTSDKKQDFKRNI